VLLHRAAVFTPEVRRRQVAGAARRVVVVELGAGSPIASVRHFSDQVIHEHSGRLVRFNPREPDVPTQLDVGLAIDAAAKLKFRPEADEFAF
jgi:hypothetical protein